MIFISFAATDWSKNFELKKNTRLDQRKMNKRKQKKHEYLLFLSFDFQTKNVWKNPKGRPKSKEQIFTYVVQP